MVGSETVRLATSMNDANFSAAVSPASAGRVHGRERVIGVRPRATRSAISLGVEGGGRVPVLEEVRVVVRGHAAR